MREGMHIANPVASVDVCNLHGESQASKAQTANMEQSERPLHYLREWRLFRKLSQQELANRVDTTKAVISLLESGERGLSDKWLRRLAPVLGTRPGAILDFDPHDLPRDVLEIWLDIEEEQRPQAIRVLETFRKASNGS